MGKNRQQNINPALWLEEHGDLLYRFARCRVKDSFTAEDLVQETLLSACQATESYIGAATISTWLVGILKHKIADYYRSRKPEQTEGNPEAFADTIESMFDSREKWKVKPQDWGKTPERKYEQKELRHAIDGCLDDMDERMSQVFSLREIHGVGTDELCRFFDIEKGNFWVILYRARMILRRCLEFNWFEKDKETP